MNMPITHAQEDVLFEAAFRDITDEDIESIFASVLSEQPLVEIPVKADPEAELRMLKFLKGE